MLVGIYLTFTNDPSLVTVSEKKLRYKKRYWLYYVLQFLSGTRRHIFTTFAIFIPIIGGVVWDVLGFEITFIFGAAVAFISFLFCLMLQRHPESPDVMVPSET